MASPPAPPPEIGSSTSSPQAARPRNKRPTRGTYDRGSLLRFMMRKASSTGERHLTRTDPNRVWSKRAVEPTDGSKAVSEAVLERTYHRSTHVDVDERSSGRRRDYRPRAALTRCRRSA